MQEREPIVTPGNLGRAQTRRGLGRMLGGLATLGAIAAAAAGDEAAGKKRKKRAQRGSQGPAGPAGPAGPSGPAGTQVTFVTLSGDRSSVLGAAAGAEVQSVVECGLESTPVNCGWGYVGNATDFDRTVTQAGPEFFRGVGMCTVRMRRTAAAGAAGGQVYATAICTR